MLVAGGGGRRTTRPAFSKRRWSRAPWCPRCRVGMASRRSSCSGGAGKARRALNAASARFVPAVVEAFSARITAVIACSLAPDPTRTTTPRSPTRSRLHASAAIDLASARNQAEARVRALACSGPEQHGHSVLSMQGEEVPERPRHSPWHKSASSSRLRLSGFGPRPYGTRSGREGGGTYTIPKFTQCLPEERSQPKTLGGTSTSARARAISKVSIAAPRTPALRLTVGPDWP